MAGFGVLDWQNADVITVIASVTAPGTPAGTTTAGINTTGANFIAVAMAAYTQSSITPVVTDNKGNTYTLVHYDYNNTAPNITGTAVLVCASPTVGAGHTFSTSDTYSGIGVMALHGPTTPDQHSGFTSNFQASISPGSITPTVDGSFLMFAVQNYQDTAAPGTPAGGWNVLEALANVPGATYAHAYFWQIQASAAPINPTSVLTPMAFQECTLVNFK